MKMINSLVNDLLFLFKGVGILLMVIIIGVALSKLGVDSLTSKKDDFSATGLLRLDNGSYQLTFLGEKVQTPPAIKLGEIKNQSGQIMVKMGKKQWVFSTTLQIGQVDVLFKVIKEKIRELWSVF